MRKNISRLAGALALAFLGTPLFAEGPSSIILGGGVGFYQFTEHPTAFNVYNKLYQGGVSVFPSVDPIRNLATLESLSSKKYEGRERKLTGEYERRFGKDQIVGLTVGLSYTENRQLCQKNCGDIERTYYVASIAQTIAALPADQQLLAGLIYMSRPDILDSKGMQSKHTLLDVGFNLHMNPDGDVDPYIGAVAGAGICSVDNANVSACTAFKYGGRLGARLNLNKTLFLVVQGGLNRIEYNLAKKSGLGLETSLSSVKFKIPTPEQEALFALGVNF